MQVHLTYCKSSYKP